MLQTEPVRFGSIALPPDDPYAGKFTRLGGNSESAEIVIMPLDAIDGSPRYFLSGFAIGNPHPKYGPNMGELSAVLEVDDELLWANEYRYGKESPHKVRLKFDQDVFELF